MKTFYIETAQTAYTKYEVRAENEEEAATKLRDTLRGIKQDQESAAIFDSAFPDGYDSDEHVIDVEEWDQED